MPIPILMTTTGTMNSTITTTLTKAITNYTQFLANTHVYMPVFPILRAISSLFCLDIESGQNMIIHKLTTHSNLVLFFFYLLICEDEKKGVAYVLTPDKTTGEDTIVKINCKSETVLGIHEWSLTD